MPILKPISNWMIPSILVPLFLQKIWKKSTSGSARMSCSRTRWTRPRPCLPRNWLLLRQAWLTARRTWSSCGSRLRYVYPVCEGRRYCGEIEKYNRWLFRSSRHSKLPRPVYTTGMLCNGGKIRPRVKVTDKRLEWYMNLWTAKIKNSYLIPNDAWPFWVLQSSKFLVFLEIFGRL